MNIVWYPTLHCCYRCAYCNSRSMPAVVHGNLLTWERWVELFKQAPPIEDLIICGGEPSLFDYLGLVLGHTPARQVHVATNLARHPSSWITDDVVPKLGSVLMSLHFDPDDPRAVHFWERAVWARERLTLPRDLLRVSFVLTQQVTEAGAARVVELASSLGLGVELIPFNDCWSWRDRLPRRCGTATCTGGKDLAVVLPDGQTYRCLGHAYTGRLSLGNLCTSGWNVLLSAPTLCTEQYCTQSLCDQGAVPVQVSGTGEFIHTWGETR